MQQIYLYMISLGWLVFAHPFHLSLTEIKWNKESEQLEISQKIFWDDLEIALSEYHKEPIDFLNPSNPQKLNKQIEAYLLTQNKIWIDEISVTVKFLGYEIEEDAAWFYLESEKVKEPSSLKIKNTLLIKNFSDQNNVVQVYFGSNSPKSIILGKGKESGVLSK
ncbi:hypothetical protein LV84_01077 [Algoriphagus ratkowskyi]|uniref:Uncharacterized protein n=1 Tax=Algoriphagus ratkowskyi TaxID=57028 RepID=A0A2W7RG05_9BACT|nr:DUF6702 family protein [Algoriphagus ratkowskyi]PZX59868.1 hypothetical protein LV84_01077 [Algoriphagus ratkowskyi]TXD78427.1 hypothetical protein ESW18_06445 [Algoriphagus ratkowskyi]